MEIQRLNKQTFLLPLSKVKLSHFQIKMSKNDLTFVVYYDFVLTHTIFYLFIFLIICSGCDHDPMLLMPLVAAGIRLHIVL